MLWMHLKEVANELSDWFALVKSKEFELPDGLTSLLFTSLPSVHPVHRVIQDSAFQPNPSWARKSQPLPQVKKSFSESTTKHGGKCVWPWRFCNILFLGRRLEIGEALPRLLLWVRTFYLSCYGNSLTGNMRVVLGPPMVAVGQKHHNLWPWQSSGPGATHYYK